MREEKRAARLQVLQAAAKMLEEGGREAISTRAMAAAAGITAPALFRLFGDKEQLLAELGAYGFEMYLEEKREALRSSEDPVKDLYRLWDLHVDFGLRHPTFYVLMFGTADPGQRPPAADDAYALLVDLLDRTADAGRLRVPVEEATRMVYAAATGATLALIGEEEARRGTSSTRLRDTVINAIITDAPASAGADLASRALALDAALAAENGAGLPLLPVETALLRDWLRRLAI